MAEKQCLKAPKEEERETKEEEGEGEKPVPKLQDSVISVGVVDCLTEEKKKKKKKKRGTSQEETLGGSLVNSSKVENLEELDVKPMVATPLDSFDPVEFKAQLGLSHQEALSSVTAQAHANLQLQTEHPHSVLETSLSSLKPSMSSALGASPLQQILPALEPDHSVCKTEEDLEDSSDQELKFPHGTVKTQANDGFNWRKYGQKLVKSSESSRSYYRCTTRNCHAKKKVERCDHTGNLINTIYKGQHNHEPPRKIRCTKARRCASSAGPGELIGAVDCPVTLVIDSDLFGYKREFRQLSPAKQLHSARDYNGAIGVKAEEEHCHERYSKEEHFDEPQSKRSKMKGRSDTHSLKPVKEQKVVVQAPGDVGISGDGYRWRKYGQKMVKGNPNPRSYYKCTSAGCPVRKHVERATDDTSALKITYEGKHDHDMPVPKKRQGPPSATLLIAAAAAAAAMNSAQLKKPEPLANNKISAQWSMDMEGQLKNQKASEFGGEKALESAQKVSPLESARTLLSIGIELRPY